MANRNLSERLKEILGEAYNEQTESSIKALIGEQFVAREDFNDKNKALKAANEKIAELSATDWQAQLENQKKTYEEQIAAASGKFNEYRLDNELKSARVRNTKAARALLDAEKIKYTDSGIEGLKEQLEALQKSDSYLFDPAEDAGAGGFPGTATPTAPGGATPIPHVI